MKRIIKDWKHIPGIHCGSVSIRDVVHYYGIELSEAMCFGMGSGLGFFYAYDNDMSPSRNIHVRGPHMEPNFFSLLSDTSSWKYEQDDEKALNTALEFLKNDIPVFIQTDIYYLGYYNSNTHFPGHVVVLCGFDDGNEIVYLSDTGFDELQKVSFQELKKSRSSKSKPYPLNNNWFEISRLNKDINLSELIPISLKKNAEMMIEGVASPRGTSGVDSIKKLAEDLPAWGKAEDWRWCVRYSYQVIQKRGTCGAGFRWMYREYLKEAESYFQLIASNNLTERMGDIGSIWFEVSNEFKRISELSELKVLDDSLINLSKKIFMLYEKEKEFFTDVLQ